MRNVIKSKLDIFKQKTYIIIYGTCTFWGKMFDIILLIFIFFSSILAMMESIKGIDSRYHEFLVISEWVITIFFTIEYILRLISHKKPLQYVFSFYGIIDLISLLPMYLSFFIIESKFLSIIRILRLLRVFRILELAQFSDQANELRTAIYASRTKILVFIYFVMVSCVLLGALMYMIEPHDGAFTSIPMSIYWCVVTLTTVGYGDVVPTSVMGQIVASMIMILGYGVIAVPTGIITSEYSRIKRTKEQWAEQCPTQENRTQNLHLNRQSCSFCGNTTHHSSAKFCQECGNKLDGKV